MIIRNILIANRALSALKFISSLQKFLSKQKYTVCLYGMVCPNDIQSRYKYIELLDKVILVSDDSAYINRQLIVDTCKQHGIEAVWPGWGYLSEDVLFVDLLERNDIIFIGPSSATIRSLGDKARAMIIADQLNIPQMKWSNGTLSCISGVMECCNSIGYPVIIKDVNGGGGKGIRVVRNKDDLQMAYQAVKTEASGDVLVMRLAENCKHVEVQIVGDGKNAIHLHGRDCTTQRRNQKLIEEGPIVCVSPEIIKTMEYSAVRIAEHVCFKGLGTVEFLYETNTGIITFIEVNPRLQVEHTVTELLFDVNLPSIQYQIACGASIGDIPELKNEMNGHVFAVRVTSEDPYDGFSPRTGTINKIVFDPMLDEFGYFSLHDGGKIVGSTDPQFGHIFVKGSNRENAINRMESLLSRTKVFAPVPNSIQFLKQFIMTNVFIENNHTTTTMRENNLVPDVHDDHILISLLTCALSAKNIDKTKSDNMQERGHRRADIGKEYPVSVMTMGGVFYDANVVFKVDGDVIVEHPKDSGSYYSANIMVADLVQQSFVVSTNNEYVFHVYYSVSHNNMFLHVDGVLSRYKLTKSKGIISAPGACRVTSIHVHEGDLIKKGDPVLSVEIMKMSVQLNADTSGKVCLFVSEHETVDTNHTVAVVSGNDDISQKNGELNMVSFAKYNHEEPQQQKIDHHKRPLSRRDICEHAGTTYIYDLMTIFSFHKIWRLHRNEQSEIERMLIGDPMYENEEGMVAWELEYSNGQRIVVVANDITVQAGSFAVHEDVFFCDVSRYCRKHHVPRIHVSCNSGARLSIGNSVIDDLHIQWKVTDEPDSGLSYLYLDDKGYEKHKLNVKCIERSKGVWEVIAIDHTGRDNLDGSGQIARETLLAYHETFTLTYVTGRSVGIGAYLCKLGERVIQKSDSPILLTGANALNSVMGQAYYKDNLEIGGPSVMAHNGVSHIIVDSDEDGVRYIERWISYLNPEIPRTVCKEVKQIMEFTGPIVSRELLSHIMDTGSIMETLVNWGHGTIVARGKIMGKSIGIISSNNENGMKTRPVDHADPKSSHSVVNRPGCVLFPDTARKVSRAIMDIDREGLPLLLVCDYRGFSGGTNDMYDEILTFGSDIVSALSGFRNKIIMYVPPFAQLRGGAMVVLTKSINPDQITMFADKSANINVLEPSALQSIMFRESHMQKRFSDYHMYKEAYSSVGLHICELHEYVVNDRLFEIISFCDVRQRFVDLLGF